jgi:hypothetical protein
MTNKAFFLVQFNLTATRVLVQNKVTGNSWPLTKIFTRISRKTGRNACKKQRNTLLLATKNLGKPKRVGIKKQRSTK